MIFPVRCYTCNHVIGHMWEPFRRKCHEQMEKEKLHNPQQVKFGPILDEMGVRCEQCRVIFMTHVTITTREARRL